jgi:hypothetical protein
MRHFYATQYPRFHHTYMYVPQVGDKEKSKGRGALTVKLGNSQLATSLSS